MGSGEIGKSWINREPNIGETGESELALTFDLDGRLVRANCSPMRTGPGAVGVSRREFDLWFGLDINKNPNGVAIGRGW